MPRHEQTWVKVNAAVDYGVADLVEALSRYPALQTLESCERNGDGVAQVSFSYGRRWTEMADFSFGYFSPELYRRVGDDAAVTLYWTVGDRVVGSLRVRSGVVATVAAAISDMARRFSASPPHRSECSRGMGCTAP